MSDGRVSWAANDAIRRTMTSTRPGKTAPELALRRALHRRGLRFRVGYAAIPRSRRTVDIAFVGLRVAVFLDGCFWHSCPIHGTSPRRNADYWGPKLQANVVRDRHTDQQLRDAGWEVVRIWEHEDSELAAGRIVRCLKERLE